MGSFKHRTAWSSGDYSCDSYLSELGIAKRRPGGKGVLKEVKPNVSRVGDTSSRHPEKLRASVRALKGFVKMIKWILYVLKPLKESAAEKHLRETEEAKVEKLRSDVGKAARNISNLTQQLKLRNRCK